MHSLQQVGHTFYRQDDGAVLILKASTSNLFFAAHSILCMEIYYQEQK